MAIDNDLSALLPDPPPPRPARREAAIDEALRRFDGDAPSAPVKPRPEPARTGWGRPQIAALASVALVVLVSVPIWWSERDRIIPQAPPTSAAIPGAPRGAPASVPAVPQSSASAAPAAAASAEPTLSAEQAKLAESAAIESNLNRLPQFAPAQSATPSSADAVAPRETTLSRLPVAPPPPAPAARAAAAAAPPPPPPPPAQRGSATARRAEAEAEADEGARIVVTGSRIQRQDYNSNTPMVTVNEAMLELADDWNLCTLADPDHDLDACRAFADPAGRGAKGRAGTQLADGLGYAWRGDFDHAIAAFDRAIDSQPDLAIAYLNRGLAWQAKGDMRRAVADLNRAIAADPRSGAAFYHRSLLQRARGNDSRADADARRAVALGPR